MSTERPALNIHLYLTPNCNLACTHCYYEAWSLREKPEKLLSVEDIRSVITTICEQYRADFHVEGGEVFLRSDLSEIFDQVPESYWRTVTLTTSGTTPIRVGPDHLKKLGNLRISVEGHTDALQSMIRGVSLKPVVRTCERLAIDGVPFEIRITLFRENARQLRPMLDRFSDLGAAGISFYEYQPIGRGEAEYENRQLTDDDVEDVLDVLAHDDLPTGVRYIKLSLPPRRAEQVKQREDELADAGCTVARIGGVPSLTINYDGGIGVSPWKITANRIADQFATLGEVDLGSEVARRFRDGTLLQTCDACSEFLVKKVSRTP